MTGRNAEWHALYQKGETYSGIAQQAGVTRNTVAGAVQRFEKSLQKIDGRRSTGPTRAQKRAAEGVKSPKGPRRHPADPASVQAFDTASQSKRCLWVDGDLRDGSAVVCGHYRTKPAYCDAHHARAHDGRPRKAISAL